jgi:hypothetical protein
VVRKMNADETKGVIAGEASTRELDLSSLSREQLGELVEDDRLPVEVQENAAMLFDLTDPEGPWSPIPGDDLSKEWTVSVPAEWDLKRSQDS